MQALDWYYRRLNAMTLDEIAWRTRSLMRNCADRFLVSQRQRIRKPSAILNGDGKSNGSGFCVSDKSWLKADSEIEMHWYDSLLVRAEQIIKNRLDFFDLKDKYLGNPIDWNRDHKRGLKTPMIFSPALDYRDVKEAGDCKFVWEPNRHHHLVVLGRAYHLSGDIRFANAVVEQLNSWLNQNPYGVGMNWRSGLELGIRLINWIWAIDLIEESGAIDGHLRYRILDSVARHIWEIDRKYSRCSSTNNHLVGEAAGVFVAASYFKNLRFVSKWQAKSREILCHEIINQTHSDGGPQEQAIGYHFFVLQFFVIVGITARKIGQDMPKSYWSRLEKIFEFLDLFGEGGDKLPMFGDCDDGYVLDLGSDPHDIKDWLAVGAALFGRSDFKKAADGCSEPVMWLLGQSGHDRYKAIPELQSKRCTSVAFCKSGYYLLQYGRFNSPDLISVVFDCGPLGMGALAGHGHADALSFTLRVFGIDVLVDPGTYDYFSYPEWRRYFRSTQAHNTIVVDGQYQSEMQGPFLWGRKAKSKCLSWEPTDFGGIVVGEHDGYTYLDDPVIHRRTLNLNGRDHTFIIKDEVIGHTEHKVELYFHLAEHCIVKKVSGNYFFIDTGRGTIKLEMDRSLKVKTYTGSENPICGWISRGYHQKKASTTIVGYCVIKGSISLVCKFDICTLSQGFI